MKRWIFSFLVFPIALVIGLIVFHVIDSQERHIEVFTVQVPTHAELERDKPRIDHLADDIVGLDEPPKLDPTKWQADDESKFRIKLAMTGQGFHGDEVYAKTGQTWLGLFRDGDKFELRETKVKVVRSHDPVLDKDNEKTGKDVSVASEEEPVFLLRNARTFHPGSVETAFYAGDLERGVTLDSGFKSDYKLGDRWYRMANLNGTTLTLESEGVSQILYHLSPVGDATWELIWAGDLDNDGKLDIFANIPVHYNFMQYRLFLSGSADSKKLVKQVGMFHLTGC